MDKCYESVIKYFFFVCNLVFALAGLSMVAFGAYVQINSNLYKQFIGSDYVFLTTFIIVIGNSLKNS